jgi:hypothetical protein
VARSCFPRKRSSARRCRVNPGRPRVRPKRSGAVPRSRATIAFLKSDRPDGPGAGNPYGDVGVTGRRQAACLLSHERDYRDRSERARDRVTGSVWSGIDTRDSADQPWRRLTSPTSCEQSAETRKGGATPTRRANRSAFVGLDRDRQFVAVGVADMGVPLGIGLCCGQVLSPERQCLEQSLSFFDAQRRPDRPERTTRAAVDGSVVESRHIAKSASVADLTRFGKASTHKRSGTLPWRLTAQRLANSSEPVRWPGNWRREARRAPSWPGARNSGL